MMTIEFINQLMKRLEYADMSDYWDPWQALWDGETSVIFIIDQDGIRWKLEIDWRDNGTST